MLCFPEPGRAGIPDSLYGSQSIIWGCFSLPIWMMPIPERNSIQFGEQLICYLCVPFLYVFLSESIKRSPRNLWCTVKTVTGKNSGRRTGNADQGSYKGRAKQTIGVVIKMRSRRKRKGEPCLRKIVHK